MNEFIRRGFNCTFFLQLLLQSEYQLFSESTTIIVDYYRAIHFSISELSIPCTIIGSVLIQICIINDGEYIHPKIFYCSTVRHH